MQWQGSSDLPRGDGTVVASLSLSLSPEGMFLSGEKDKGWPGIGIVKTTPLLLTPGNMRCKWAAAASAYELR